MPKYNFLHTGVTHLTWSQCRGWINNTMQYIFSRSESQWFGLLSISPTPWDRELTVSRLTSIEKFLTTEKLHLSYYWQSENPDLSNAHKTLRRYANPSWDGYLMRIPFQYRHSVGYLDALATKALLFPAHRRERECFRIDSMINW